MMLFGWFLIFLGFVSAFSFSDILPIPMVISFAMLLYLALNIMKMGIIGFIFMLIALFAIIVYDNGILEKERAQIALA